MASIFMKTQVTFFLLWIIPIIRHFPTDVLTPQKRGKQSPEQVSIIYDIMKA